MSSYAVLFKDSVTETLPEPRMVVLLSHIDDERPELRVKVSYITRQRRKEIAERVTGKNEWTNALDDKSFQRAFLFEALKSQEWEGMTKANLKRFGEFFFLRPALVDQIEGIENFPKDRSDFDALFGNMREDLWVRIINVCTSMDEFQAQAVENQKNE